MAPAMLGAAIVLPLRHEAFAARQMHTALRASHHILIGARLRS